MNSNPLQSARQGAKTPQSWRQWLLFLRAFTPWRAPHPVFAVSRLCLAMLLTLFSCMAFADDERDAAILEELLKLPSPAPDWRELLKQADPARDGVPPPDADLATLAEFWRFALPKMQPDRSVPARLLEWCESHPEDLDALLRWFPTDAPEFHDRLKAVADRLAAQPSADRMQGDTLSRIRDWLMVHSRYYRDDLISRTRHAFAGSDPNFIDANIKTLVRLDRPAVDKLLSELAGSTNTVTRTAALVWLHELDAGEGHEDHAGKWREALQKVVADGAAPPPARAYALQGLLWSRWPGQEAWFLGLFRDASLGEMRDGSTLYHPSRGGWTMGEQHPKSRADHRRSCRLGEYPRRACRRGHPVPDHG